jgi:hypothetical protein
MLLTAMLAATACNASPDWQALYAERLGEHEIELDESYLNAEFKDPIESGSLTRVAWAKLKDGSLVLLGLPPHGLEAQDENDLEAQEVVERTVILREEEWEDACGEAFGEDEVQSWRMRHAHRGNSLRIYINNQNDAYCEFFYLPQGWELRTVQSHGILKAYR